MLRKTRLNRRPIKPKRGESRERERDRERGERRRMGGSVEGEIKDEKNPKPLDEDDIALLKTYVCIHFTYKP